jgi:photosystem II stability/assembly factor-like uncharacterized protein
VNQPSLDLRFTVNVAITVLATLVIASIAYGGTARLSRPIALALPAASPTPSKRPAAAPSPVNPATASPSAPVGATQLSLQDLDLTDSSTGWILLTSCSSSSNPTCEYSVAATQDGGATWSKPSQVGPAFDRTDGNAPRTIRFLNRVDGFVFGFAGAFVTHDGGKTWSGLQLPSTLVYGIAAGGTSVWALTSPCAKGVVCQLEVRRSGDGGRSWLPAHALPPGFSPESLVTFGSGVMMSSVPTGDIQITSDTGATWRAIKTQCTGNPFRGYVATADGNELWELCGGYPDVASNTADRTLFVSENGGKYWSQRSTSSAGGALSRAGYPMWLVSNRSHVGFVSSVPTPLLTHDAGASWSPVGLDATGLRLIRFSGQQYGWALEGTGDIWSTTDGGESWSQAGQLPADIS